MLYSAINFCRFASPFISQLSGSQILNYLPPRAKNSCESTTSPWFHSWVIRFNERCTFSITYSKLTIFSHILPKPESWSRQFTQNTSRSSYVSTAGYTGKKTTSVEKNYLIDILTSPFANHKQMKTSSKEKHLEILTYLFYVKVNCASKPSVRKIVVKYSRGKWSQFSKEI